MHDMSSQNQWQTTAAVCSMSEKHNPRWKQDDQMFSPISQPTNDSLLIWLKSQQKGDAAAPTLSSHLHTEETLINKVISYNRLILNRETVLRFCDKEAQIMFDLFSM